ncbi:MAG: hypothetical protein K8T26_00230 [Lentisphaerae bacterium]|nr:hypothetical protein [Lentisphaerota bacterium]
MKTHLKVCIAGIATAAIATLLQAAPAPDHMGDRSLIESGPLPRLSLGANIELLERDIDVDNRDPGTLKGSAYSGYLGVDATRWLTVHGTAGAMFLDSLETAAVEDDFDSGLRWSVGLNASLWHVDLEEPEFARGRLSIGATAEYLESTSSGTDGDVTWSEVSVTLPLGFEIPNDPMLYWGVYSLFLYAGPVFSQLDGNIDRPGRRVDFSESQDVGVLGGADIYMARNLSLGGQIQYFDAMSANISARYHF